MSFQAGDKVWLRCEVKAGPFSNERMVRIQQTPEPWVGFADVQALRDHSIETGANYVLGRVLRTTDTGIIARVEGHALQTRQVWVANTEAEKALPNVPLSA